MSIEAINLEKKYLTKKRIGLISSEKEVVEALKGVSFEVGDGEIVGLLGPNGAGKTTTVKILSTLLIPDSGRALVNGLDVVKEAKKVRKIIGIMLTVEKGFYGKLTGKENLEYFSALYGLKKDFSRRKISELMELLGLRELGAEDKLFEEYSLGMKARLSLARALLKDPPVLILDEPTLGLDPPSSRKIRELVMSLAKEEDKTVLYTTHNMFEAEILCDRILLINEGEIVAEGTPRELKRRIPKLKTIEIIAKNEIRTEDLKYEIERLIDGRVSISADGTIEIKAKLKTYEKGLSEILGKIISLGLDIVSVKVEEPTLEDVFVHFTSE